MKQELGIGEVLQARRIIGGTVEVAGDEVMEPDITVVAVV